MTVAAATIGFASLLVYDLWTVGVLRGRLFRVCFKLGLALWVIATVSAVSQSISCAKLWRTAIFGAATAASLGLEIYLLFLALPKDSYTAPENRRRVCDRGAYGLCRHPGFWSLAAVYLFLSLALPSGKVLTISALITIYNLVYILFQDRFIFEKTFTDYAAYKARVPFLIPRFGRRNFELHSERRDGHETGREAEKR